MLQAGIRYALRREIEADEAGHAFESPEPGIRDAPSIFLTRVRTVSTMEPQVFEVLQSAQVCEPGVGNSRTVMAAEMGELGERFQALQGGVRAGRVTEGQ